MYNVANFIITDRKMYRCFFKVSFSFRGSLYEINVLLTLFLQIEVSIEQQFLRFYTGQLAAYHLCWLLYLYRL